MGLTNLSFDHIAERDLRDQIQSGIPEGILIDYKRDVYGRADADVREFLKDISSFANTAGGHLIIGMDEANGIPTAIVPLTGDADQELQGWKTSHAMALSLALPDCECEPSR